MTLATILAPKFPLGSEIFPMEAEILLKISIYPDSEIFIFLLLH